MLYFDKYGLFIECFKHSTGLDIVNTNLPTEEDVVKFIQDNNISLDLKDKVILTNCSPTKEESHESTSFVG